MRKSFTAGVLVLGMALGSILTMALNPIGAASALVSGSSGSGKAHESVLQEALDTLVGKGTISQSQADAVENQVQANVNARMATHPRIGVKVFTEVAAALKMQPKQLRSELFKDGKSIAQVAQEHGVSPSSLANQIVAGLDKAINAGVAGHHVKQQNATTMEQNLPARVNAFINHVYKRHPAAAPVPSSTTTTTH